MMRFDLARRLILSLGLCLCIAASAFAQQRQNPVTVGWLAQGVANGVLTQALSSAAGAGGWGTGYSQTGLAYSYVPTVSKQISKIMVYASAVNGTLGASDLVCNLYSDSAGAPNASIESRATVTSTPTGAAWVEFTGFTATSTTTAGTMYWIVLRNANATPTVNYPTYRWSDTSTVPFAFGGSAATLWGTNKIHTTDGGATWGGTKKNAIGGFRVEYSDGTFEGVPVQNLAAATGDYVYGTREAGTWLTTPANATWKVIGVSFPLNTLGSTHDNLRLRLYTGSSTTPTRAGTTATIPRANIATSAAWVTAYFSAPITVTGGTVLRVVFGNSGVNGDTSNAYRTSAYTIQNSAGSKALFGYAGAGLKKTVSTDGTTFTDTDTEFLPFSLILDTDGEFQSTGSSGVIGG